MEEMECNDFYYQDDLDKEFDEQENISDWSDCNEQFESDLPIISPSSTRSITRILELSTQYWPCDKCNQLNNLKETMSKYDMKCFRCDAFYDINSNIIELNTEEQSLWKCVQCTFCNPYNAQQCEICSWDKPDPILSENNGIEHNTHTTSPSNTKYRDSYSTNLVRGYLRTLCNFYLPFRIPFNSSIADVLCIVVIQFYTFCNFWDMKYLKNHWEFDKNDENKSTLILCKDIDIGWRNAFSAQKVEFLAHYSWTLQIQDIGGSSIVDYDEHIRCWIGVIESNHRKAHDFRYHNNGVFCTETFGYGICGYNGNKRHNNETKEFCVERLEVNDIICVKLQCTRAYYELMYSVNGEYIGCCDNINRNNCIAYRLPNDKVYEMVIATDITYYKIKCIAFDLKPYMDLSRKI